MLHLGSVVLALIFGIAGLASAQTCTHSVRGLVEDTDGEILPGATIFIESLQRGVASGDDGRFLINELCPGSYRATI